MKRIGLPNVNSFLQAAEAQAETNDAASANSSHLGGTSHFTLNEGQAAAEDHILYEVAAGDGTPAPIELQNARHQAVVDQVADYYRSLGYTVTKDVRFIDDATRKVFIADLVLSVDPIVAATVEGKALITGASGAAIPGVRAIEVWTLVSSTQVYR